ncbi:non-homologous end-joining DNA ligase [Actinopolyspora halophila]|uniref:non-homologous end-joining DNA ligase n=1 Tax=Actinopolyspora halophila TaxID=1850 RepID=UPI000362547E|nr:non-homologous end-joining DNA ligase [Actinopolyspora halophila]
MNALFDELSPETAGLLRRRPRPEWSEPTLATLVHEPFDHPDWLFEPKMDGQRCLIVKHGSKVRILSRNDKPLDDTYPEIREAAAERVGPDCVLDGEVVAFSGNTTSFARLQQRMQLADTTEVRNSGIVVYCYLFDILHAAGHDTTRIPLRERKKLLARTAEFSDPLRWTPHENRSGQRYHRGACAAGWEGTLAKDATAAYQHGRSRSWMKFKCVNDQELVVGGFTEPTGSRPALGALLVGYHEHGRFAYAGKVGTGFAERTLRELRAELDRLERADNPFAEEVAENGAHWVEPRTVVSIAFTEWTEDGKLRHPTYRGLRRDKDPSDVTRESR